MPDSLEVSMIQSVAGTLTGGRLIGASPFRGRLHSARAIPIDRVSRGRQRHLARPALPAVDRDRRHRAPPRRRSTGGLGASQPVVDTDPQDTATVGCLSSRCAAPRDRFRPRSIRPTLRSLCTCCPSSGRSLQALMTAAFNGALRKYGEVLWRVRLTLVSTHNYAFKVWLTSKARDAA